MEEDRKRAFRAVWEAATLEEREACAKLCESLPVTDEYAMTTLWLGAFRYYCGRMTYAVSDFCSQLIGQWPALPEKTKVLIQRDLEAEFKRDDEARADGQQWRPLGNDCDRQQWERVRQLWATPNAELCGGPSGPSERAPGYASGGKD